MAKTNQVAAIVAKAQSAVSALNGVVVTKNWRISGTDIFGATKEELKPNRRELNVHAGVYEVETKLANGQIHEATPAHKWPFRIAKGPDHPHVSPQFKDVAIGQRFKFDDHPAAGIYEKVDHEHIVHIDEDGIKGSMNVFGRADRRTRLAA